MSDNSPYFFMKEFSSDELAELLTNKVKELKAEKAESEHLNERLQENLAQLEETSAQLEETQEALKLERDNLKKEVKHQTSKLVKMNKELNKTLNELKKPTLKSDIESCYSYYTTNYHSQYVFFNSKSSKS